MVNKTNTSIVVKDSLKTQYFRFSPEEWQIIELFNGQNALEDIVKKYNETYPLSEIDLETVQDYRNNLDDMNLLQKSKKEMNVLLVEKVKEMREFQLLSKKGSLMYKRFPIVDPDKFFNKIIPYCNWIWSKGFFIFSSIIMLAAVAIILSNWDQFNQGMYALFSFSEMSVSNFIILWIIIYATIALHEIGHGLTCKYYGGEVHEIGFLLLFFQPCLYCNVNDAWLFDKKWKQIMVTIAGGYVEFFIGAICSFIWILTNPGTLVNTLSFQVMTICSISTIMFNFNPLIKLDGYYLLSDFLEVPNLKEDSGKYLKHWVKKCIFRMPVEEFYANRREKRIYLAYALASSIWMFLLLTGLVGMAKGLLVDQFHAFGIILTGFIAYKLFKGHVLGSLKFLAGFYIQNKTYFNRKDIKYKLSGALVALLLILFIPTHYKIKGTCTLEAEKTRVLRSEVDGKIVKFYQNDGDLVSIGDKVVELENISTSFQRSIAQYSFEKAKRQLRKTLYDAPQKVYQEQKNVSHKLLNLKEKQKEYEALTLTVTGKGNNKLIISCNDQTQMLEKFVNQGDEICKLQSIDHLMTVIEVSENEVRFLRKEQDVKFKLISHPAHTYQGKITEIRPSGKADPKNPQRKSYQAIIKISNPGQLRPSMRGVAKIYAQEMSFISYMALNLAKELRLDLFF